MIGIVIIISDCRYFGHVTLQLSVLVVVIVVFNDLTFVVIVLVGDVIVGVLRTGCNTMVHVHHNFCLLSKTVKPFELICISMCTF